jgi:hypothetical protein
MAKMMVKHNNFSVPKGGLFYNKKIKSNTLVIDDFGDYFEWMAKFKNDVEILKDPTCHRFTVKMGLSIVNHEDGDQFVRKVGYKLATEKLVDVQLTLASLMIKENGDLVVAVREDGGTLLHVELGPRGRMMIMTNLSCPYRLYNRLYQVR